MSFDIPVSFNDLPLFGHDLKVSGTATVRYSANYGGFATVAIDIDRQFAPTLQPRPPAKWPSPSFKDAVHSEAIRMFEADCVEDVEFAIRQHKEEMRAEAAERRYEREDA